MAQKPLMLKDYLELDWNREPSGTGFLYTPRSSDAATVRCLLEAELRGGGGGRRLPRARSTGALKKLAAVINAVRLLPFATASSSPSDSRRQTGQEGFLSRSFWKRLRGSFWKKRGKAANEEEKSRVRVKDIVWLRSLEDEEQDAGDEKSSFDFPSPFVSSCSNWSESDSSVSDSLPSSISSSNASNDIPGTAGDSKKDSPRASPSRKSAGVDAEASAAAVHRAPQATESGSKESPKCRTEEEQKLSPVLIMDFPSEADEEEDEEATSPSFHHSLAKLERTKLQLLQKIRRFESLVDLDPFACSDYLSESSTDLVAPSDVVEEGEHDDEEDEEDGREKKKARGLLGKLNARSHVRPQWGIEKLLVDFFIQGLSSSDAANRDRLSRWSNTGRASMVRHEPSEEEEEVLLKAARDWIKEPMGGDLEDDHGKASLREMERWRLFEQEQEKGEEELGGDLVCLVLSLLMEELVVDLVSC